MSDKAPVLDLDEALNRALEDVDFLKMMMEEFQASIPDFVGKINAAIDAADMHGLDEIAHQFKGAAANLGAKQITAVAFELEMIGKNENAGESREAFERLRTAIADFNAEMARIDWASLG